MRKSKKNTTSYNSNQIVANNWKSYTLIDSGKGRKLEKLGKHMIIRPEPRAIWRPALPPNQWDKADAEYLEEKGGKGKWEIKSNIKEDWIIDYGSLNLSVETKNSRQIGVFPENAAHWDWFAPIIQASSEPIEVLNLFGYTGLASLKAAECGANVTHIDSSRHALRLGKENQKLSKLENKPIRWIEEDVSKFVQRAVRRGTKYHGIILDPPAYGLGPKKEKWEFEKSILPLCKALKQILHDKAKFVIITAYAVDQPPDYLMPLLDVIVGKRKGIFEAGHLTLPERSAGRKLNLSITARWKSNE